jgi:ABC-type sugar transport system ATPase subunit
MGSYLEMHSICKAFYGNPVLTDVSLNIELGKVYSLVGENGAGKSTLMKILYGALKADSGYISLNGKKIELDTPLQGIKHGIAMISQELAPVPEFTIAENIFLGREHTKAGVIDYNAMNMHTQEVLDELGISYKATAYLKDFKVSDIQLIEICKAISYDSQILIMDEPTSSLSRKEIERLYELTDKLIKKGKAIIFISHKIDEIFRMSDEVFVLRDGYLVAKNINIKDLTSEKLIALMVGRELNNIYPKREFHGEEVVLQVENLTSDNNTRNVSFELRKGEILGIAGLVGSGRTEMAETLFGLSPNTSGRIYLDGKEISIKNPKDAIKHKMAFITEDRKIQGLFLQSSIRENISLLSLGKIIRKLLISTVKERKEVNQKVKELKIKSDGMEQLVNSLSGGNQQKVVIAKWLMTNPYILILDEPTRGVDIGAKFEIYKIINELTEQGCSVIFISSELPEVIGMSDRVLCFCECNCIGELSKDEISQESIMKLATGVM